MPIALVALDFDPVLRLGDRIARLETIVLAVVLLAALLVAARIATHTPGGDDVGPFVHGQRLRIDDFIFIVLAIVPGAVIGGRLGYVLIHLDYYGTNPAAIVDPAQGSLQVGLGLVGGALSGIYAARLLDQPVGRWLHVAALPTLLAIAGGKVAQAVGGGGQGAPSSAPWATSYVGPGPWGSLGPTVPSHPAQLYEAALTALVAILLIGLLSSGAFGRRDGRAFLVAAAGWAVVRIAVATTWRDPAVLGPLRADQLISLGVIAACIAAAAFAWRAQPASTVATDDPQWPEPETRPRF